MEQIFETVYNQIKLHKLCLAIKWHAVFEKLSQISTIAWKELWIILIFIYINNNNKNKMI